MQLQQLMERCGLGGLMLSKCGLVSEVMVRFGCLDV